MYNIAQFENLDTQTFLRSVLARGIKDVGFEGWRGGLEEMGILMVGWGRWGGGARLDVGVYICSVLLTGGGWATTRAKTAALMVNPFEGLICDRCLKGPPPAPP